MSTTHSTYVEAQPDEQNEQRLALPARHLVDIAAIQHESEGGFRHSPFLPEDVDKRDIDLREAIDTSTVEYEDDAVHMRGSVTFDTEFAYYDDQDIPVAGEAEIEVYVSFRFEDGAVEGLRVKTVWIHP
jgi:hypothetical protein